MGKERAISYSHRIRLNGGCVFVVPKWKCGDSVRISLRWGGQDR